MHESAKLVPFIHAPHLNAIAHAKRHALCEVDVVGDQQRPAIADIDDEALMARTVVIIM